MLSCPVRFFRSRRGNFFYLFKKLTVYGLSDNICCSVHTLLWTFPCLSILVRLRLPRLGQPAEISIQRWTFCKDIVSSGGLERCCCPWGSESVYGLSDNICCSVHALLWTFPCLSILVRLRLPRLGQPAEISIQRWTFCKDIVLLVVWRGVVDWIVGYCLVHNKKVNCAFYNRNQSKKQS